MSLSYNNLLGNTIVSTSNIYRKFNGQAVFEQDIYEILFTINVDVERLYDAGYVFGCTVESLGVYFKRIVPYDRNITDVEWMIRIYIYSYFKWFVYGYNRKRIDTMPLNSEGFIGHILLFHVLNRKVFRFDHESGVSLNYKLEMSQGEYERNIFNMTSRFTFLKDLIQDDGTGEVTVYDSKLEKSLLSLATAYTNVSGFTKRVRPQPNSNTVDDVEDDGIISRSQSRNGIIDVQICTADIDNVAIFLDPENLPLGNNCWNTDMESFFMPNLFGNVDVSDESMAWSRANFICFVDHNIPYGNPFISVLNDSKAPYKLARFDATSITGLPIKGLPTKRDDTNIYDYVAYNSKFKRERFTEPAKGTGTKS